MTSRYGFRGRQPGRSWKWMLVGPLWPLFFNAARVFLGELNERCKNYTDINNLELIAVIPLAIIVLFLGVYPQPLIDMISPAIETIISYITPYI